MLIVPQTNIDIVSSNVPDVEVGIEEYNPNENKTYNLDDEVQYKDTIYKCLKDNTSNTVPGTNSLIWSAQSKTNKYRMFDAFMSSGTSNANSIQYKFNVGDVDTVAFFGLVAQSVRVIIKDANENILYDKKIETSVRHATNWYDWTYIKPKERKALHFRGLPMVYNATMEIIINNGSSIAECTHLAFGTSMDLGITLLNPSPIVSVRNIIPKTKNDKGIVLTSKSLTYRRVVANVMIENELIDEVQDQLDLLNAEACLFIADEREQGYASLLIFGLYKDFDIPIGYEKSVYQIEIEGVV